MSNFIIAVQTNLAIAPALLLLALFLLSMLSVVVMALFEANRNIAERRYYPMRSYRN
jgi:hypothetical protein